MANIGRRSANQDIKLTIFSDPLPILRMVKRESSKIKRNRYGSGFTWLKLKLR
jgi:hypothetical protein